MAFLIESDHISGDSNGDRVDCSLRVIDYDVASQGVFIFIVPLSKQVCRTITIISVLTLSGTRCLMEKNLDTITFYQQ